MRDTGRRGGRTRRRTRAQQADRYALYQEAVQDAPGDVTRLRRMYQREFGRDPRRLREDFCGTALLACTWARRNREHEALGVDLDPEPLAWGRRHNLAGLRPEQAERVRLVRGDVRHVRGALADLVVAFNFSYFVFREREELRRYFRHVHSQLAPRGLFVLDAYGGPESQEARSETREHDHFDYVWDQDRFDPISHRTRCYIHFRFPDRSRLDRAFRYDWRLWTLPEIREVLLEGGFARVDVYWEGTETRTNEPNGIFTRRRQAPDDPAWVAYIVAVKSGRGARHALGRGRR